MSHPVTYTEARANLAALLDDVTSSREPVVIRRRGHDDVALVAADELASLQETAHLLRSPANARRLLSALQTALNGEGQALGLDDLRREVTGG
jgi:antitoxin YefM